MTSYTRMKPEQRKESIIQAAAELTKASGGYKWTKQDVSDWCQPPCSVDTVKHYFRHKQLVEIVKARLEPKKPT